MTAISLTRNPPSTSSIALRAAAFIGMVSVAGALALGTGSRPVQAGDPTQGNAACGAWDAAAIETLISLVRGKDDAQLRMLGDAVFRVRRARRNCEAGWTRLACQDYRAIVHTMPGSTALAETNIICASLVTAASGATLPASLATEQSASRRQVPAVANDCEQAVAAYAPDGAMENPGGDPYGFYVFNRAPSVAVEAPGPCTPNTFAQAD
jgi:hypothetical protein